MDARSMAQFIEMPKLSDTMTEGTLVRWLKKEGDKVVTGEVIAEVETDKATMEMVADDSGILGRIYVQAGGKAPLGGTLAVLVEPGETPPDAPAVTAKATGPAGPSAPKGPSSSRAPGGRSGVTPAGGRIKASPLAKKVSA